MAKYYNGLHRSTCRGKKKYQSQNQFISNAIYGSLFTILTLFGITYGYFAQEGGFSGSYENGNFQVYVFILSQVLFTVSIYILSLFSSLQMIWKQICYLNEKVENALKEKIKFWENETTDYNFKSPGIQHTGKVIISVYFAILFLITFLSSFYFAFHNTSISNVIFFLIELVQVFLVIRLYLRLKDQTNEFGQKLFNNNSSTSILP